MAGLSRRAGGSGQGNIQWLNATVPIGTAGQFTEINLVGATATITGPTELTITVTSGGSVITVSGTSPISVDNTDPANPIVEHDPSGVTPGVYGDASHVPAFIVDAEGHITGATNVPIVAGVTYTDTGILVVGGAIGGEPLVTNAVVSEVRGMSLGEYDYDSGNCQLWVYPAPLDGTVFELDVWVLGFTAASAAVPTATDSIVAAAPPSITGTLGSIVTATVSQATWTGSPLQKGDMLTVIPTTNSAATQWYCLFIPARRTF